MTTEIYIYNMERNYWKCEVWCGDRKTHSRAMTSTLEVDRDKKLTRRERHAILSKYLIERFAIKAPEYKTGGRI